MNTHSSHIPRRTGPLQQLGGAACRFIDEMGAIVLFFLDAVRHTFIASRLSAKVIHQIHFIGSKSLAVIALIAIFTGMVLGLQGYYTLVQFGSVGMLGGAVALTLIRELGPVLTAIMVIGRAGSAMAAEIGVMRITDQIDALEVMDVPSMGYLVTPRVIASLIVFPVLTALFNTIGIIGGYLTGVMLLGVNSGIYFYRIDSMVNWADVSGSFVKSIVFALIVSTISCYNGYFTHMRKDGMGPEGVSNATTSAVVMSCVLVLVADYIVTSFLL